MSVAWAPNSRMPISGFRICNPSAHRWPGHCIFATCRKRIFCIVCRPCAPHIRSSQCYRNAMRQLRQLEIIRVLGSMIPYRHPATVARQGSSVLRQLPSTIRRPSIQAAAITHHRLSIIMVPAAMCTITTDMDTDTVTHRIPGGSEVKAGTNDSTMSASTRMCIDCTMAARRSYWPPDRRMTMTSRANTARVVNFFFAFVFCQNNSE